MFSEWLTDTKCTTEVKAAFSFVKAAGSYWEFDSALRHSRAILLFDKYLNWYIDCMCVFLFSDNGFLTLEQRESVCPAVEAGINHPIPSRELFEPAIVVGLAMLESSFKVFLKSSHYRAWVVSVLPGEALFRRASIDFPEVYGVKYVNGTPQPKNTDEEKKE